MSGPWTRLSRNLRKRFIPDFSSPKASLRDVRVCATLSWDTVCFSAMVRTQVCLISPFLECALFFALRVEHVLRSGSVRVCHCARMWRKRGVRTDMCTFLCLLYSMFGVMRTCWCASHLQWKWWENNQNRNEVENFSTKRKIHIVSFS